MLAHDDIPRLDVAVEHAPRVGIVDGVANVEESAKNFAELQRPPPDVRLERRIAVELLDRLLETIAFDEPHRVIGPAIVVAAQAVDRHNARVLEPPGDLGLDQEPLAATRVVGMVAQKLFQRHLAVQLGVQRHEDGPQPTLGVGPKQAKPLAVRSSRPDRVAGRAVGAFAGLGRRQAGMGDRGIERRITESTQAFPGRSAQADGRQALLRIAAVLHEMSRRQGLDRDAIGVVQVTASRQMVGQRPGLVASPGLEGGDELGLVDEPDLQRDQANEEVAVRGGGHGVAPIDEKGSA